MMDILSVTSSEDLAHVRTLFTEYAASLDIDFGFENFHKELFELPGDYTPPHGRLLLAREGSLVAGCVALRKISADTCEMRRLYVRTAFRGHGVGRALVLRVIDEARNIGYRRMRLYTLHTVEEAIALYQSMSFRRVDAYRCHDAVEGAIFMELTLV